MAVQYHKQSNQIIPAVNAINLAAGIKITWSRTIPITLANTMYTNKEC